MNFEERQRVIALIGEVQSDDPDSVGPRGTAPVSVRIGSVDDESGIVKHGTLIIEQAPDKILNVLRDEGYSLSVENGGVVVEKN